MEGFICMITLFCNLLVCLILAPLLPGIVNRTKAVFAGRHGPPFFQLYWDIFKLMRKGTVYSRTSGLIFRLAPMASLSALICAAALLPGAMTGFDNTIFANFANPLSFQGDILLFLYLLVLSRFFTVLGALDTGSSFEGMGASREVQFAVYSEPAFILGLAALCVLHKSISLSGILSPLKSGQSESVLPFCILVASAFFVISLVENCRVPFDDPNTHLELTMIHEVMVLDYSGPELGIIFYASSIKFYIFASIVVQTILSVFTLSPLAHSLIFFMGLVIYSIVVGIVESVSARLRLIKIPQVLTGAGAISFIALIIAIMRIWK